MRGLRKGNVALSKAPVIPGARSADMAQGIERYPFQLYTHTRTGMVAWVLSGVDVDDTMAWCDALKSAGVKGSIRFEPKRKSMTARARHSLQQLVSPGDRVRVRVNPTPTPNPTPNPNPSQARAARLAAEGSRPRGRRAG